MNPNHIEFCLNDCPLHSKQKFVSEINQKTDQVCNKLKIEKKEKMKCQMKKVFKKFLQINIYFKTFAYNRLAKN